jgi:hypothetical protein
MSYLDFPRQILFLSDFHDHVLVDFTIEYQAANQYQTLFRQHESSYANIKLLLFWIIPV